MNAYQTSDTWIGTMRKKQLYHFSTAFVTCPHKSCPSSLRKKGLGERKLLVISKQKKAINEVLSLNISIQNHGVLRHCYVVLNSQAPQIHNSIWNKSNLLIPDMITPNFHYIMETKIENIHVRFFKFPRFILVVQKFFLRNTMSLDIPVWV